MHLVKLRTSAMNRAHGVLTQFGVTLAFARLRQPDRDEMLTERGVPEVWRRSIAEAVAVVRTLDERLVPLEQQLRPIARADPRVQLLVTIPGGEHDCRNQAKAEVTCLRRGPIRVAGSNLASRRAGDRSRVDRRGRRGHPRTRER
jgi:hypothetical protein